MSAPLFKGVCNRFLNNRKCNVHRSSTEFCKDDNKIRWIGSSGAFRPEKPFFMARSSALCFCKSFPFSPDLAGVAIRFQKVDSDSGQLRLVHHANQDP